jgi:hypothetical protein
MSELNLKAFEGDMLNRLEYAKGLLDFIGRLDSGVIAIDGEWGSGKSWLGENLKRMIDDQKSASTVWIDAFDADWEDDPSLSLIANIASQLENHDRSTWIKDVASCLVRLIPAGGKSAARVAGNLVGIDKEVVDGLSEAIKDGSDSYIEKRLHDLADKKKSLAHLKGLLTKAVNETPANKVIIFIDELDRCSPEYAIRFLERLKHLFDINRIVYVLFWNRLQIQKTVEMFYGAGTNGQMYLDKFIDFPLHLPLSHARGGDGPMSAFLNSLGSKLSEREKSCLFENYRLLNFFATLFSLTARETQHFARWWVMSPNRNTIVLETWLLVLKVKRPNLFSDIRGGNRDAHLQAKKLIEGFFVEENFRPVVMAIADIHDRYYRNNFENLDKDVEQLLGRGYMDHGSVLPAAIRRLETFT